MSNIYVRHRKTTVIGSYLNGERPLITKLIMKPAQLPVAEEGWIALEREAADAVMARRRLR